MNIGLEVTNLLNQQYEITPHYPLIDDVHLSDFDDFISIASNYYSPPADANHDGVITPLEDYESYVAIRETTDDYAHSHSPPRRVRIGITMNY